MVWLEAPPERILREVRGLKQQLPPEFRPEAMVRSLELPKKKPASQRRKGKKR
jgi:hypothetical protein